MRGPAAASLAEDALAAVQQHAAGLAGLAGEHGAGARDGRGGRLGGRGVTLGLGTAIDEGDYSDIWKRGRQIMRKSLNPWE